MKYVKHVVLTVLVALVSCNLSLAGEMDIISNLTKIDDTVLNVLSAMPDTVSNHLEYYRLLVLETASVETEGTSLASHGNFGIYGIRVNSIKEVLTTLKNNDPDIYTAIMKYHDAKLSWKDNLVKNTLFSTACCVGYYCTKITNPQQLVSLENRAKLWKKTYNTYQGKGSVNGYMNKAKYVRNAMACSPRIHNPFKYRGRYK